MTKEITVELPDEVYAHIAEMAAKAGRTPEEWIGDRMFVLTPRARFLSPAEVADALARLKRSIVSVPDPKGSDNEQIDRDLAEEYASTHEDH